MTLRLAALAALTALGLLSACAASHPDRFYILSAQPPGDADARTAPLTQVHLRVTLPSAVDRPEMVLNDSADGVIIREHERWASLPSELAAQALARDLERRRADLLVSDAGAVRSGGSIIKINVDVVQVTVHRGQQARIEAHWRISDARTGREALGGEVFSAPLGADDYAAIAQGLSRCIGLLADRLAAQLPLPSP